MSVGRLLRITLENDLAERMSELILLVGDSFVVVRVFFALIIGI